MQKSAEADDRVLIVHGVERGKPTQLKSFTLPDPRNGRPQAYLLTPKGVLQEVNRFKQQHSAWLTADKLMADGGMFLASPVDPLLVLLPILDRARDKSADCPAGKFKALDEILYDQSVPGLAELVPYCNGTEEAGTDADAGRAGADTSRPASSPAARTGGPATAAAEGGTLEPTPVPERRESQGEGAQAEDGAASQGVGDTAVAGCAAAVPSLASLRQQLACVCDVRRIDDDCCYYRLNDQRALAWLSCKLRQVQAALAPQVAGMEAGAALSYALGFLSEYLGDPWVSRLAERVGTSVAAAAGASAGSGSKPVVAATGGEDAAPRPGPAPEAPPEKKQKLGHDRTTAQQQRAAEAKQAAMAKQAAGTKKITGFFMKGAAAKPK